MVDPYTFIHGDSSERDRIFEAQDHIIRYSTTKYSQTMNSKWDRKGFWSDAKSCNSIINRLPFNFNSNGNVNVGIDFCKPNYPRHFYFVAEPMNVLTAVFMMWMANQGLKYM